MIVCTNQESTGLTYFLVAFIIANGKADLTYPPGENGRHFADGIFKNVYMNEKFCILIRISMKFIPRGLIDNKQALVPVMAWRRTGDKPLSEPILIQFMDVYMCP